jgi:hypothetical protein
MNASPGLPAASLKSVVEQVGSPVFPLVTFRDRLLPPIGFEKGGVIHHRFGQDR